jgi:hypothetical protein
MVELIRKTKGPTFLEKSKALARINAVIAGILAGTGEHPNAEHGQTVAQIAWWNEFGTAGIPARPFLRPAMKENRSKFVALAADIIKQVLIGKMTTKEGEALLGLLAQRLIRREIDKTTSPPNAPETLRRKAPKTHPLIHTGALKQHVNWGVQGA